MVKGCVRTEVQKDANCACLSRSPPSSGVATHRRDDATTVSCTRRSLSRCASGASIVGTVFDTVARHLHRLNVMHETGV